MKGPLYTVLTLLLALIVALAAASPAAAAAPARPAVTGGRVSLTIARDVVQGSHDGYYSFEALRYVPPNVTPVVVHVATMALFNNSGMVPYNATVYIPPGNYSLILAQVSINESGGPQYDRALYIYVNGTPIFWGSTQEMLNSTAEVDLTLFENLLQGPVRFQIVLPNYIAPRIGITGHYNLNMTLYLYPGPRPAGLPNYFIPLFVNSMGYSHLFLTAEDDYAEEQVQIPNGTYRAWLLLYTKGSAYDEFWYTNEPPVRYVKVLYDGRLAGVVNPFETVYTGGINLFWWKPVTSINTLAFHMPYFVDLTPMLAYGLRANISVSVADLRESSQVMGVPGGEFQWTLAGVLVLWVNSSNPMISATPVTYRALYHDTGPQLFLPGVSGLYFQEGASYSIVAESLLTFEHGEELVSVRQWGTTTVNQMMNYAGTFAYDEIDELFDEDSTATGYGAYNLTIEGNWPAALYYDFYMVPITSPTVYPFNATFAQNGSMYLDPSYAASYGWRGFDFTTSQSYSLVAVGGFSGILEFISPTGAVVIGLTSNNGYTVKQLDATVLYNGHGFTEESILEGVQNSTINMAGYLVKNVTSYELIGGGLS